MSLRVVVADDEKLAARILAEGLEEEGHAVLAVVHTAEEAAEAIEKNVPDLVYLDVNFNTSLSGFDVLKRVHKSTPQTRVCLMSGYRDECRGEVSRSDAYAFVGKPAQMEDFLRVAAKLDASGYNAEKKEG
jgi:DNA-binding NtrC family response regulator